MNFDQAESKANSVIISANPKSGSGDRSDLVRQLAQTLESDGFAVHLLNDIDEVCQMASQQLQEGVLRTVVSAGGDGTASLLVNRLPAEVPITILPLGTANLMANYLQIRRDVDQVAGIIRGGKSVVLDAGLANGSLFLVVASCGFDAAVVERLHKHRTGHISKWSYSIPILKSIWKYKFPALRITADGKSIPPSRWAFVLNVPRYAMDLNFIDDADTTDGLLDMCTFEKGGLFSGLYYLFSVVFGRHRKIKSSNFVRFKRVTIEADESVPYEIDGDPGGKLPLTIEAVPGRMRMCVPDEWLESVDV